MRRSSAPLLLVLLSSCATRRAGAKVPRARVYEPDQVDHAPPREPEVGVEVLRIARTCRHSPAVLGGDAVAVRWSKRFDFPEGS